MVWSFSASARGTTRSGGPWYYLGSQQQLDRGTEHLKKSVQAEEEEGSALRFNIFRSDVLLSGRLLWLVNLGIMWTSVTNQEVDLYARWSIT